MKNTIIRCVGMLAICMATNTNAVNQEELDKYFSFGIAVMFFDDPHIEDAEVRGGVVRITDQADKRVTPWLQTQYILDGWWDDPQGEHWYEPHTSHVKPGVFLGVGLGQNGSSLDTFGVGFMFAMKRTPWSDKTDKNSLNIGLGWYTTKVNHLPNDAQEGDTLPAGVESVPTLTESESGWMINMSFSI
jgi:hypothetical protein